MKVPGKFASFGLAVVSSLVVGGCASQQPQYASTPTETTKPAAVAQPQPAPDQPRPAGPRSTEFKSGLVNLSTELPDQVLFGKEFESKMQVVAVTSIGDVVVSDRIPAGASFVRSEPTATVEGDKLIWKLGDMEAGQTTVIRVRWKAEREGDLRSSATVMADPRISVKTFVGRPVLAIEIRGPESVIAGAPAKYTVVVTNSGTAVAEGVVASIAVPEGLKEESGKKTLEFNAGNIPPKQSKQQTFTLTAGTRGKTAVAATVVGSNVAESSSSSAGGAAARTQASAATVVLQPDLKVELTGPKEQILGRAAGYEIVVSNPGDTVLANVIVSSPVPKDATNVVAKDALIQNGQATWTIPELKTGAQLTRTLSYSSSLAGTINCNATAASGNLRKNAQASTVWRGVGGLLLQASESPDPVEVGDTCTYSITVANQGFGDLHNLKIVAQFPEQLDPISSPNGNVSGKTVNLLTFPVLEGGKEVVFTILAKGVKPGDGHTKITLSCDEEKYSLKEENTTVY